MLLVPPSMTQELPSPAVALTADAKGGRLEGLATSRGLAAALLLTAAPLLLALLIIILLLAALHLRPPDAAAGGGAGGKYCW
jgi:hypothetical protein